jgi:hypothetical protein
MLLRGIFVDVIFHSLEYLVQGGIFSGFPKKYLVHALTAAVDRLMLPGLKKKGAGCLWRIARAASYLVRCAEESKNDNPPTPKD